MGANVANTLISLCHVLAQLYLTVWILRVLLQLCRADFYNPVSQLVWRFTRLSDPLRRYLRPYKRFDVASFLIAFVFACIYAKFMAWFIGFLSLGHGYSLEWTRTFWYALRVLVSLTVNLYTFSLVIQALLSWFGPGVSNPAANILWSLNEPLLRPVRRWVKPQAGLDLSPMIVILGLMVVRGLLPAPYLLQ